jgi:hypothetical protein
MPEDQGAFELVGAPAACKIDVAGPKPINLKNTKSIPAAFWDALNNGSASAAQHFVNRITLSCR